MCFFADRCVRSSKIHRKSAQYCSMAAARSLPAYNESDEEQQKVRFQVELEFVQCLANPNYLNFLAQRGIFKESTFINYLKYLLYWKEPQYARYLKYPHCLHMLDLLQSEHFRKELMNSQCARFIDDQQLLHWQHYQRKRIRLLADQSERFATSTTSLPPAAGAVLSQTQSSIQLQQPHSASSTSISK